MKTQNKLLVLIILVTACLSVTMKVTAEEKIEEAVLGMNVSGTNDLPNVLYIIPWKADDSEISPPEISRLVDEIYAPVDPDVFAKQVKFYYQLTEAKNNTIEKGVTTNK